MLVMMNYSWSIKGRDFYSVVLLDSCVMDPPNVCVCVSVRLCVRVLS